MTVLGRKHTRRLRPGIGLIAAMILLIAGLYLLSSLPPAGAADETGEKVDRLFKKLGIIKIPRIPPPVDFVLPDLNGRPVRLSDFKGRVVVLNFWTTWCPDCRREMPALETLHQRFKERPWVLLAVDLRESGEKVAGFFQAHGLSFTALLDQDGAVGRSFGIRSIPTTFIIDGQGAMIGKAMGSRGWENRAAAELFEILMKEESP